LKSRHAEAAFFFELHTVALDEFGVDHHDESGRIAPDRQIDHDDPQRNADLWRGQSDAGRGVHRLDHVVDEPTESRR